MNLNFNSIRIENFLSIDKVKLNFNDQGVIYIRGVNNDSNPPQSNGSGKSSIFDAILWTLYGETLRGASEVKNSFTNDGTLCELSFSIDDSNYTIRRAKSHSTYGSNIYVYENGELISDSIKKSQETISNILSISSAQILGSIVLLGQGLPYKFSDLSQIKRKELLEELSGSSEQIAKIQNSLNKEKLIYDKLFQEDELQKKVSEGKISGYTETLKTLKSYQESQRTLYDIDQDINICNDEILKLNQTLSEYQNDIKRFDENIYQYNKIILNTQVYINSRNNEKFQISKEANSLQSICPVCKRPFDSAEDIENHRKELNQKINEIDTELSNINLKLKTTESLLNNETLNKNATTLKVKELESKLQNLNSKIINLNNEKFQSQNFKNQILEIETNIDKENIEINKLQIKINESQNYLDCIGWLLRETSREFKGVLLQDIVDLLSDKSQEYGKYLVDQTIKVSLSGNKVLICLGDTSYENLSGGERRRVDLSIQFALREMLSMTNGFSCNLLVLDEVFDNLDIQGAERLLNLISSKFSDVESLYIITHHTDFDIPYDQILTITKNNGTSTLQFGT